MQIISTNLSNPTTITWRRKQVETGIYKTPTQEPIYLGKEDVKGDVVSDRRVHGGEHKACYIFSLEQYPFWQDLYPDLNWEYGMLGENLTVSNFNEKHINVGDIYKVGGALVQITQPREPCFKFGVKFGTQKVLKQFIDHGFSGTYLRILEEGNVKKGDEFVIVEQAQNSLTVYQFFNLLFAKTKDQDLLQLAINNEALPQRKRDKLKAYIK
ncbi:MAG: MOSC domain-containing protein [Flavobacteriaceae bacterium]|nr:MOSC domain-containing protein [Bacteroidia bacterium]NNL16737.1 MOSC domain-containing protein [Flavobacteriaceae bacterium]